MNKITWIVAGLIIAAVGMVRAEKTEEAAQKLLAKYGAVEYAMKDRYGGGIDRMFLGYDGEGRIVAGAAVRETKTYKKVHTMAVVILDEKGYKIAATEVPDLHKIPGKANSYVSQALDDIAGKTFSNRDAARGLVDAVSGATKYYKSIYVSYSLMTSKIIEEIENNPEWERKPVPSE